MTAQRWWVRLAARWLARIDGVSNQLRLAMLIMTGLSTATLTLRQYGHGQYAWPLIGTVGAVTIVYTYLYTEHGVWNQVNRDRQDLSSNYAGPGGRIRAEMIARAIAPIVKDGELTDEEREWIERELDDVFKDYREGMDMEEYE